MHRASRARCVIRSAAWPDDASWARGGCSGLDRPTGMAHPAVCFVLSMSPRNADGTSYAGQAQAYNERHR
jgi:hypothetical protein